MGEVYSKEELANFQFKPKLAGSKEEAVMQVLRAFERFLATIEQRDEVIESLTANIKQLLYPETKGELK